MDPLTAALNCVNTALQFAQKIWDAMPQEQKAATAADWATFTHNIGKFITSVQDKVNASVR